MMSQEQDGGAIANYYNPGDMAGGNLGGGNTGENHQLQDYQMQLMLLEQQNKKRLMMARRERRSVRTPRARQRNEIQLFHDSCNY